MTDPKKGNTGDKKQKFATRVIHAGQSPDPSTGAIMPPIYATSTYVQSSPGVHQGLDYGRSHNPTRWALERCVADLEGGAQAFAFASGLAAISTTLELLDAGCARDRERRPLRRHLPPLRACARTQRRHALQLRRPVEPRRGAQGHSPRDAHAVGRDAEQPAAQARRPGARWRSSRASTG
jgi:hypothetical protein